MQRLGELLVIEYVLTPEALDAALARVAVTGDRLGSAAIDGGASADRVAMVLARQHGVLAARDHQLSAIPASMAALAPEDAMRELCAVPLRVAGGTGELIVAVRDPGDPSVEAELVRLTGKRVRLAVAAERRLRQALDVLYRRASADNPLRQPTPVPVKPPPEAPSRRGADLRTGAVGRMPTGWRKGTLWRRLLERGIVVGLIACLIGAYVAQRRRGASEAAKRGTPIGERATTAAAAVDAAGSAGAASSAGAAGEDRGDPPGELDRALDAYREQLARCRKDAEVCLANCRRDALRTRDARCDEKCTAPCAHLQMRVVAPGAVR